MMKRSTVFLLFLGVLLLVAVLTNPNQDRHKEVLKNKLNEHMQQNLQKETDPNEDEWSKAGRGLGMLFGDVIIDKMIDSFVTTDNYVLFSLTKVTLKGETRVIGIGAFGNVYVSGKLDEVLNQQIPSR